MNAFHGFRGVGMETGFLIKNFDDSNHRRLYSLGVILSNLKKLEVI